MSLYRADIDGLRALSVLVVIGFHAGLAGTGGGFVGVDVFFVISGFLITGIIAGSVDKGNFSFIGFYQRRIARILPALAVTLVGTLLLGALFLDPQQFDRLGKEAAFAAVGVSNILYSFGVDYFADDRHRPLLHTWSLGVEEQFYLIWPAVLAVLYGMLRLPFLWIISVLFATTLAYSVWATPLHVPSSYFLLQFRAFELLAGAFAFGIERDVRALAARVSIPVKELVAWLALAGLGGCVLLIDKTQTFPGALAVVPVVCTAVMLLAAPGTSLQRLLSLQPLVYLGLISYPLYLLHQPALAFLRILFPSLEKAVLAIVVLVICIPLAALIYRYIETPSRRLARVPIVLRPWNAAARRALALLVAVGSIAVIGLQIAWSNGWSWRLYYLNKFSYDIAVSQRNAFFDEFENGFLVNGKNNKGKLLIIGDSMAQQYVVPLRSALGLAAGDVDVVSRGSCLLLKNVKISDGVAGVSCDGLRDRLYSLTKRYDVVVIAHNWEGYLDTPVSSSSASLGADARALSERVAETALHFKESADQVIVMGWHPRVNYSSRLSPNLFTERQAYERLSQGLHVVNRSEMQLGDELFGLRMRGLERVTYLEPVRVWCAEGATKCHLNDGRVSYFFDALHFGRNAVPYVTARLKELVLVRFAQSKR